MEDKSWNKKRKHTLQLPRFSKILTLESWDWRQKNLSTQHNVCWLGVTDLAVAGLLTAE